MAYKTRQQVVLAKMEVAYGADPGPDPAVNAILCGIPTLGWVGDPLRRDVVSSDLSPFRHLIGLRHCTLSIPAELKPSGVLGTAPEIGPLLRACGLGETINPGVSVRYDPVSNAQESVTLWHHVGYNPDGNYNRILGARGDLKIAIAGGSWGVCTFDMQGLFKGPEVFAMPTATYNATLPTQFLEVLATLGLSTPALANFSLDTNNAISRKIDVTTTHGIGEIWISGREPGGSLDPETISQATKDYVAEWIACTEQTLEVIYGTVGGNRVTIHIPKAQYIGVSMGDSDGLLRTTLPYKCNRTVGNDEFYILFD